jgi:uncharacterized lipoprotein YddW (UPF0748 family)
VCSSDLPVKQGDSELPFPDDAAWERYLRSGGQAAREAWRREQVDMLVQSMQRVVRGARPGALFSISPFGVGRPDRRPPGITGFSQYDRLYADVERWLAEGWLDLLVPQLYWPVASEGQPFAGLLDYWLSQNPLRRGIRPGLFSSRVGAAAQPWAAAEIVEQIALARQRPGVDGHAHFSLVALADNRGGLAAALRAGPYAEDALPPEREAAPGEPPPAAPVVAPGATGWRLSHDGRAVRLARWQREAGRWRFFTQAAADGSWTPPPGVDAVVFSAVDRWGRESPRTAWTPH